MPSFADHNRAAHARPLVTPPGATPAAAPTWGRAVTPSAAGEVVGPQETGPSILATVATLAVVGGLFWWVTSGPKMARGNPASPRGANELVTTARLADHYEHRGVADALDTAEHDVRKIKREAPELWQRLRNSNLSDRKIGDWLNEFISRWQRSGMSFKNFAADELEQGHAPSDG